MEKTTRDATSDFSFRDPAGHFWMEKGRAFRWVLSDHAPDILQFLSQAKVKQWIASKKLVASRPLELSEVLESFSPHTREKIQSSSGILLEHECIEFPSYPYEWSPAMLHAAAGLTLELAEESLTLGYQLKDATPYNVLFDGPLPCWVDLLSFEKRNPLDGTWRAYGQFVRTFLLPLLANKHLGMSLQEIYLPQRDGLDSHSLYKKIGFFKKWRSPFLSLLTLPNLLEKSSNSSSTQAYKSKLFSSAEQAQFVLKSLFKHLRRLLKKLKPISLESNWTQYAVCGHCSEQYEQVKAAWVKKCLARNPLQKVLDIGCNLGHYSEMFTQQGAQVVSIDLDSAVIDKLWRKSALQKLKILPLLQNLAWPSPGLGWANQENRSFLDRASGHFDGILMYAVIHHLLITAQIPLPQIVELISKLNPACLIIEYVDPQDEMFKTLLRGREDLYAFFNPTYFENCFSKYFEMVEKQNLDFIPRTLYYMKRK